MKDELSYSANHNYREGYNDAIAEMQEAFEKVMDDITGDSKITESIEVLAEAFSMIWDCK